MAEQVSYKGIDSFFQVGRITFMQLSALRSLRTIINLHRSWVDNYISHQLCRLPEQALVSAQCCETYFAIHGSANGCHQCLNLAV